MQLKSFIKDLAFVQVVNFAVKPLWIIVVDRAVQNQLGNELYGEYFLAFNLAAMFFIITDLGLNNYLTKNGVDYDKSARSILLNSFKIKIFLSLVYFAAILLLGWQRNIPLTILTWVGLNMVLLSLSQWVRVWFNVSRQFRKESIIAVIDRVVAILLWLGIFALITIEQKEILKIFLGVQTAGFLAAIGGALLLIHLGDKVKSKLSLSSIKEVVLDCLPFTLLAFFMAAFTRLDVILMDFLLPNSAYHIGVYAHGAVLLNAGNMMAALFGTMLLPIFTKQIKLKEQVQPIMRTSGSILLASGLVLGLFLAVAGEWFFSAYYKTSPSSNHQFYYELKTFIATVLVYIPMALTYVFGTYLTALGKLRFLVSLALFALLLNALLNYFLQPIYLAFGASLSAIITQSFFCLACFGYTIIDLKK